MSIDAISNFYTSAPEEPEMTFSEPLSSMAAIGNWVSDLFSTDSSPTNLLADNSSAQQQNPFSSELKDSQNLLQLAEADGDTTVLADANTNFSGKTFATPSAELTGHPERLSLDKVSGMNDEELRARNSELLQRVQDGNGSDLYTVQLHVGLIAEQNGFMKELQLNPDFDRTLFSQYKERGFNLPKIKDPHEFLFNLKQIVGTGTLGTEDSGHLIPHLEYLQPLIEFGYATSEFQGSITGKPLYFPEPPTSTEKAPSAHQFQITGG